MSKSSFSLRASSRTSASFTHQIAGRRRFLKPPVAKRQALQLEQLEPRAVFAADPLSGLFTAQGSDAGQAVDQVHVVFAPNTPAEVMASYDDLPSREGSGLFSFSDSSRWRTTATNTTTLAQGDSTTIRWSVVPDGTPISGSNGEPAAPSNLRSWLAGIYGANASSSRAEDQPWFDEVRASFDRWSAVSGVNYVYEPADDGAALSSANNGRLGTRGDVRISGHYIDGPSNILAYNFFPTVGDMVLDTGDTFFNNTGTNSIRLRNTMAHELGHGLGLDHVTPVNGTKLMEPSISLGFDGPQADDILAVNRGYGDRLEKNGGNNTAATATSLGSGSSFLFDTLSIDDDSDVDWFQVTVGAGASLSVTLTPTGSTYTSNGVAFNSLAASNLALSVYGGTGSTLLSSVNVAAAGLAESLTNFALPGAGTFFVRVAGSANAAQMYRLAGTVSNVISTSSPEIAVLDGTTNLVDGAAAVNLGSGAIGTTVEKTFTVQNLGNANLTLGSVALPAGFVLTQAPPATTLQPGAATTFIVSLNTSVAGTFSGVVSFSNNDADENPFNFNLSGTVTATTPAAAPEIEVLEGTTNIADNTGSVSFGSVAVGSAATKSFTIRNTGTADLTLTNISLPAAYTLAKGPSLTTLAPGAATSLTISLNTAAAGTFNGTLSLGNNDANESPFNFSLTGTVTATPAGPAAIFNDNFNRANSSSLGSNWTERAGNYSISSQGLVGSTSSTSVATVNNVTASDVTLTADVNLGSGSANRDAGLVARQSGSGIGSQYWGGIAYSGGRYYAQIWKATNGSWTWLSSTQINSGTAALKFEVIGTSLSLYVNGARLGSATDASFASGRVGVSSTNTGARLDNFVATRPAAPATAAATSRVAAASGAGAIQSPAWLAALDHLLSQWNKR